MIKSRAITAHKGIMSRVGITAQIGIGGGGSSSGGNLFDGTYWFSPLSSNGNDTVTAGAIVNQGLSIKDVELTTGIQTIPAQTVATFPNHSVLGNSFAGDLVEPEITNKCENFNVSPTDLTNVSLDGADLIGSIVSVSALPNSEIFSVTGDNGQIYRVENTGATAQAVSFSNAAVGNTSQHSIQIIAYSEQGGSTVGLTDAQIGSVAISTDELTQLKSEAITPLSANDLFKVLVGSGDTVYFKYNQLEEFASCTSLIEVQGAPVTRAEDEQSGPTSNALVDDGCFSSDRTTGNYVNGVNRLNDSTFLIHMNSGSTTPYDYDGKYLNKIVGSMVGSIFLNNPAYKMLSVSNNNSFTVSHPNNTAEELRALFGNDGVNPNKYRIDFHTSSLTAFEAEQLRLDVGDAPPTLTGSTLKPYSDATGVSVSGSNINIDGNYTDFDNLLQGEIEVLPWKRGEFITLEFTANITSGSIVAQTNEGVIPIVQGFNRIITSSNQPDYPVGFLIPFIFADGDGAIEAEFIALKAEVSKWLTWPSTNVTFSQDFVLYNDTPTVLFDIPWQDIAEETYAEIIGDDLKFVHGQDELIVPYTDLQVATLYNAKVSITDAELIGEVDGVEVASVTRTDTRTPDFESACDYGGTDGTFNSLLFSNVRVSIYSQ